MRKLRVLDLFSGIGGFSLGLERTGGFETVALCEIEEYPRKVLEKHWPGVPIFRDVRELKGEDIDGSVDVIIGGFPCQNVSIAGAAHRVDNGLAGDRSGLWYEYARLIDEIRPRVVIIENVDRLAGNGLDGVLRSLAAIGYDAEWRVVPCHAVGGPQARRRMWIVAYPSGIGMAGLLQGVRIGQTGQGWPGGTADLLDFARAPFERHDRVPQPLLRGMDDRPSNWVDRVKACGNAVVPQIPELIGHAILEAMQ